MWSSILLAVAVAAPPSVQVQTISGETVHGELTRLDSQSAELQTTAGSVVLTAEQLAVLAPATPAVPVPQPSTAVRVDLVDGSMIVAATYTATAGEAAIGLADGAALKVPTRRVAAVRFQGDTPEIAAQWARLVEGAKDRDLIVVRRGTGVDYHRGTLGEVSAEAVQFELDGEKLPVKRTKLQGIIYFRPEQVDLGEAVCRITDAGGSTWTAKSLASDGPQVSWTTPAGVEMTRPMAELVRLDFSQGKIVYLSDLQADSVEWKPYLGTGKNFDVLGRFFAPRQDRSLLAGPLQLEGKSYAKGLALHSRTVVTYRLPDRYRHFRALAGIDDRVQPGGNVRLTVRGDDRVLLETTIAGGQPSQAIDLDITDVRRLTIVVDFGDDMDIADHLDLAEARVVK